MMTFSSRTLAVAFASLLMAGSAFAQTAAPTAPAAPAAKTAPAKVTPAKPPSDKAASAKTKTERTAASLECSKQADAKGLHGKERRKFRSDCKNSAGKPN